MSGNIQYVQGKAAVGHFDRYEQIEDLLRSREEGILRQIESIKRSRKHLKEVEGFQRQVIGGRQKTYSRRIKDSQFCIFGLHACFVSYQR